MGDVMTVRSYIFALAAALFILAVVFYLMRRRRLRERHAVWWLLAVVLAVLAGAFPKALEWASDLVGIDLPVNLVFFVSIAILVLVSLQHSSELTTLETKTRALAESVVLLEMRLAELEGEGLESKHDRGALPEKDPGQER